MKPVLSAIAAPGEAGKFDLPADGHVQAFPLGEWPCVIEFGKTQPEGVNGAIQDDAGLWYLPMVQVLDAEAAAKCAAGHQPDMLIDWEHEAHAGGSTKAAAWGEAAVVRDSGLWVRPRWSAEGLADVTGGSYRYLSPEFPFKDMVHLGGNRYRPTRMSGLSLTNTPNLRGILAVTNAALNTISVPRVRDAETAAKAANKQEEKRKMLEQLNAALGTAYATEEEALAAIKADREELNTLKAAKVEAEATNKAKEYAGVVTDEAALKDALVKNSEATEAVLKLIKPAAPAAPVTPPRTPVTLNREATRTPAAVNGADRAARVGARARELQALNKSRPWGECFAQAQSETK